MTSTRSQSSGYRPDIDGLRAIAVLAVLFFHLDMPIFGGGFVGVDVFFVISGFLITRIIVEDIESGHFSFGNFYVRRARRLLPALFFTVAVSLVAAALILTPDHMEEFGNSAALALLSLSNFYFWSTSGYFATGAESLPLLHTWSLSVEEQFYLVWPCLLVLLVGVWGSKAAILFLVFASIASLVGAEIWISRDPAGAFYLPFFRLYEFGLGALCVWAIRFQRFNKAIAETSTIAGLLGILFAVFFLDSETRFPGLSALLPCIATCLLILAGPTGLAGKILNNGLAVGIGRVSYSLYLIHWPLIVFYKNWSLAPLRLVDQLAIMAVSLACATAMYFFVERPFRFGRSGVRYASPSRVALTCLVALVVLCAPATHAWRNDGWPGRFSDEVRPLIVNIRDRRHNQFVVERQDKRFSDYEATKALIIGDSHATDLLNALVLGGATAVVKRAGVSVDCQPVLGQRPFRDNTKSDECNRRFDRILTHDRFQLAEADYVFLSPRWQAWAVDLIPDTIAAIRSATDAKIVLFGPTVEFEPEIPVLLARYDRADEVLSKVNQHRVAERQELKERLRLLASELGVDFVDKIDLLCGSGPCPVTVPGTNDPVFVDYGHLTMAGAKFLGERLRRTMPNADAIFGTYSQQ